METDEPQEVGGDTPSVVARLSAVSLSEEPPLQHHLRQKHGQGGRSIPSTGVSDVSELSAMACTPSTSRMGSQQQEALLQVEEQERPCWSEMLPDALAKIFSRLSLKIRLCTIPCVCRYWQCVSQDAACWQDIDLSEWSFNKQPKEVDRMLLLVVNRSQGGLRRVCVPNLKNDRMLRLIASSGSQLQVLEIPDSFVSEECLCEQAPNLSALTYLDISGRFPSRALLESFGKHCQFLTRLNLNMRLSMTETKSCDVAALAIAQFMPQLQHLEMAYGLLSNVGLKALLENCRSLEHLDLRGCWHVDMEESFILEARKQIKVFLAPLVEDDLYDFTDDNVDDEDEDFLFGSDEYMFEDPEYYDALMYDDLGDFEDMYDHGFEGFNGEEVYMEEEQISFDDL